VVVVVWFFGSERKEAGGESISVPLGWSINKNASYSPNEFLL